MIRTSGRKRLCFTVFSRAIVEAKTWRKTPHPVRPSTPGAKQVASSGADTKAIDKAQIAWGGGGYAVKRVRPIGIAKVSSPAKFSGNRAHMTQDKEKNMSKKMLVVVDMLKDFAEEGGALASPEMIAIVDAVKARIEAHRALGDDSYLVYICDAHAADDLEFEKWPAHAVKGTDGAKVVEALAPKPGETIIEKTRYSGWYGTNLDMLVRLEQPEEVEVCGGLTGICVTDTVAGFANRDIATVVHKDAVADFDAERHRVCLKRMAEIYGTEII
jgi:nicotinamidase/pyrazinamidase